MEFDIFSHNYWLFGCYSLYICRPPKTYILVTCELLVNYSQSKRSHLRIICNYMKKAYSWKPCRKMELEICSHNYWEFGKCRISDTASNPSLSNGNRIYKHKKNICCALVTLAKYGAIRGITRGARGLFLPEKYRGKDIKFQHFSIVNFMPVI